MSNINMFRSLASKLLESDEHDTVVDKAVLDQFNQLTDSDKMSLIRDALGQTDIKEELHTVADKLEIADKLELVKLRSWFVKFFIVCAAFSTVGFISISLVTNSATQTDGFSFVNMIGDLRKVLEAIFGG